MLKHFFLGSMEEKKMADMRVEELGMANPFVIASSPATLILQIQNSKKL